MPSALMHGSATAEHPIVVRPSSLWDVPTVLFPLSVFPNTYVANERNPDPRVATEHTESYGELRICNSVQSSETNLLDENITSYWLRCFGIHNQHISASKQAHSFHRIRINSKKNNPNCSNSNANPTFAAERNAMPSVRAHRIRHAIYHSQQFSRFVYL